MSDAVLAVKNRPNSFAAMVGQVDICDAVRRFAPKARMWGVFGGPGAGKTTLARIAALSYQERGYENFGAPNAKTLGREGSYAIHYVNGAVVGKVENMRSLLDTVDYVPDEPSRKRVVIIDEAHRLSAEAQEALLVPTENVPDHLIWFFCTSDPGKIKEALMRRMVRVTMNSMADKDRIELVKRLKRVMLDAEGLDPETRVRLRDVETFTTYANSLGTQCAGVLTAAFEQWAEGLDLKKCFIDVSQVDAFHVVRAMKKGNWVGCRSLLTTMEDESLKQMRYLICAVLRTDILKSSKPGLEAKALSLMCPVVAYEDKVASAEVMGRIYQICQVYAGKL